VSAGYSLRDVGKLLGLPRYICGPIDAGFVSPSRGRRREYQFSFQDLVVLRAAAEAVYRQGLAHCGRDATLLFNLAIVLEDAHRSADAADMYREAPTATRATDCCCSHTRCILRAARKDYVTRICNASPLLCSASTERAIRCASAR
jgi:hypothetical protein